MSAEPQTIPQALTALSQDESLFRDAVAAFAADEVQPRVADMERQAKIDPDLIAKSFDLGLMGIEVPEEYGGAGGLAHDGDARRGRAEQGGRVHRDCRRCAEHARQLSRSLATATPRKRRSTSRASRRGTMGAYALSEPGSGSDAFGLATRAVRRGDR